MTLANDVICVILVLILTALVTATFVTMDAVEHTSSQNTTCKPGFIVIKDAFGKMACVRGYNVGESD